MILTTGTDLTTAFRVPRMGGSDPGEDFATYLLISVPRMARANPGISKFSGIVDGSLALAELALMIFENRQIHTLFPIHTWNNVRALY